MDGDVKDMTFSDAMFPQIVTPTEEGEDPTVMTGDFATDTQPRPGTVSYTHLTLPTILRV